LAAGTYSAKCNSDLKPVLSQAREICKNLGDKGIPLPLFGVGISLGGTILLNTCLELMHSSSRDQPSLDGLACISSPLDLAECSAAIERPRNSLYQGWLLQRLVRQTLEDPFGVSDSEKFALSRIRTFSIGKVSSIRSFDSAITAPRWGFSDVDDYYKSASPLEALLRNPPEMPKTLFIQSLDDPWVPSQAAESLSKSINAIEGSSPFQVCITSYGGHNGFHGKGGCWGDELVKRWLLKLVNK